MVAACQHGILTLADLTALGCSERAVHRRAAVGRLHRLHRGVYALVPASLVSARGRDLAAVLACGPSAALSHRSAAELHGLRSSTRATVEVIVPGRSTHGHLGIEVHRSVNLTAQDITRVDGIPVTTVSRTLVDLAAGVPGRQLERALDQAEVLRIFDLDALLDQIERNRTTRAAHRLAATLERHVAGSTVTRSELEEWFLALCRDAGLPAPEVNAYVDPGDGAPGLRPDFVWRQAAVAVEVDGAATHLTRAAFEADRARDLRLVGAGWRVLRVTWRQLHERPREIAATLRALLTPAQAAG